MLEKLERERRAAACGSPARSAGSPPRTRRSTATPSGSRPPPGLPEAFLAEVTDPLVALVRRYARTHGPFPDRAARASATASTRSPALRELERAGDLVRGELLPGGTEREWCDADVLRRLRRASLAHLRAEAEAVDPRELARFLPSWQNVDAHRPAGAGPDRLREALVPLQGVALTPEVWERDVLPAAPRRLQPGLAGPAHAPAARLVWIGAGALGRSGQGRALLP